MTIIITDKILKQLSYFYEDDGTHFSIHNQFGYNPQVSSSVFEDIWSQGGNLSYLSSEETMNIASTSVEDDAVKDPVGTGATQIIIDGLDGSYNRIKETISLDGTTNVLTTNSFLRVNKMYITGSVGTAGTNVGAITATASSAGTVQANIPATLGQTQKSQFTIPAGFKAIILHWWVNCGKTEDFDSLLMIRDNTTSSGWRVIERLLVTEGKAEDDLFLPIDSKTDIKIQGKSITTNNKPLNCHFEFILLKKNT